MRVIVINVAIALLATCSLALAQDKGPGKRELNTANYYTEIFEKYVERADGTAFDADAVGKDSIKRVIALYKKYPKHPKVKALFERVRKCVLASKGRMVNITPEILAYRNNEKILIEAVGKKADAEWAKLMAGWKKSGRLIKKAFPAPSPEEEGKEAELSFRLVQLADFEYPNNEFRNQGRQYCYVGSPSQGFYYVRLDRTWVGAYEALKRYKQLVSPNLPKKWTIVGTVKGYEFLVTRTGEGAGEVGRLGWKVKIKAIYIPGRLLAQASGGRSLGGYFAGEDELKELRAKMLTIKEPPAEDADPKTVAQAFITATKEKNLDLHLELIDPRLRENGVMIKRLKFFWGVQQRALAKQYVHVDPYQVDKPIVLAGSAPKGKSGAGFFLSDEEKKKLAAAADDLMEEVHVHYRKYNERGKQIGTNRKIKLRRYKGKGRWWVHNGWPF